MKYLSLVFLLLGACSSSVMVPDGGAGDASAPDGGPDDASVLDADDTCVLAGPFENVLGGGLVCYEGDDVLLGHTGFNDPAAPSPTVCIRWALPEEVTVEVTVSAAGAVCGYTCDGPCDVVHDVRIFDDLGPLTDSFEAADAVALSFDSRSTNFYVCRTGPAERGHLRISEVSCQ